MKNLLLFMFIIVAMIACEAPSVQKARLEAGPKSRVVVLDSYSLEKTIESNNQGYYYKVKVLNSNNIGHINSRFKYEAGDTTLVPINAVYY